MLVKLTPDGLIRFFEVHPLRPESEILLTCLQEFGRVLEVDADVGLKFYFFIVNLFEIVFLGSRVID